MDLFLTNQFNSEQILERVGWDRLPAIFDIYLFCCPAMDLNIRCLPSDGGYFDQDYVVIRDFTIIEDQIKKHINRECERQESIQRQNKMKGRR